MASTADQPSGSTLPIMQPEPGTDFNTEQIHEDFHRSIHQPSVVRTLKDIAPDLRACFFFQHATYISAKPATLSLKLFLSLLTDAKIVPPSVTPSSLYNLARLENKDCASDLSSEDVTLDFDAFLQSFACMAYFLFVHMGHTLQVTKQLPSQSMTDALIHLKDCIFERIVKPSSTPSTPNTQDLSTKFVTPASKFRTPFHKRVENSAFLDTSKSMPWHTPKESFSPLHFNLDDTVTPSNSNTLSSIDPNTLPRSVPSPDDQLTAVTPSAKPSLDNSGDSPFPACRLNVESTPHPVPSGSINSTPAAPQLSDVQASLQLLDRESGSHIEGFSPVVDTPIDDDSPIPAEGNPSYNVPDMQTCEGTHIETTLNYESPAREATQKDSSIEPSTEPPTPIVSNGAPSSVERTEEVATVDTEVVPQSSAVIEGTSDQEDNASGHDAVIENGSTSPELSEVNGHDAVDPASPDEATGNLEVVMSPGQVHPFPDSDLSNEDADTTSSASSVNGQTQSSSPVPGPSIVEDLAAPSMVAETVKNEGDDDIIDELASKLKALGDSVAEIHDEVRIGPLEINANSSPTPGPSTVEDAVTPLEVAEAQLKALGEPIVLVQAESSGICSMETSEKAMEAVAANDQTSVPCTNQVDQLNSPDVSLVSSVAPDVGTSSLSGDDIEPTSTADPPLQCDEFSEEPERSEQVLDMNNSDSEVLDNACAQFFPDVSERRLILEPAEAQSAIEEDNVEHGMSISAPSSIAKNDDGEGNLETTGTSLDTKCELMSNSESAASVGANVSNQVESAETSETSPSSTMAFKGTEAGEGDSQCSTLLATPASAGAKSTANMRTPSRGTDKAFSTGKTGVATRAANSLCDLMSPPGDFLSPELSEKPSAERVGMRWNNSGRRMLSFDQADQFRGGEDSDGSSTYTRSEAASGIRPEGKTLREFGEAVDDADAGLSDDENDAEEEDDENDAEEEDDENDAEEEDVDFVVDATDHTYDTSFFDNSEEILAEALLRDGAGTRRDSLGQTLAFSPNRGDGSFPLIDENTGPSRESFKAMFQAALQVVDFVEVAGCEGDNDTFMAENCIVLSDIKPPLQEFNCMDDDDVDCQGNGIGEESSRPDSGDIVSVALWDGTDSGNDCKLDEGDITMVDIDTSGESASTSRPQTVESVKTSNTTESAPVKVIEDDDFDDDEDVDMIEQESVKSSDLTPEAFSVIRKLPRSVPMSKPIDMATPKPPRLCRTPSNGISHVTGNGIHNGEEVAINISDGGRLEMIIDLMKDMTNLVRQNAQVCRELREDVCSPRRRRASRQSGVIRFLNVGLVVLFLTVFITIGAVAIAEWHSLFSVDGTRFPYVYV